MLPSILLYLSTFYTREELSLRVAIFFSAAGLAGAFSGLLAAAIQNMNGIGGRAGWAWILILEGLFSIVAGFVGFPLLPSTPRGSIFLNDAQKDILERRVERDRPFIGQDKFDPKQIIQSFTSPHVIINSFIILFLLGTIVFGLAFFSASTVNQLGYSPTKSQLLSVGPFAVGFFVTITAAYLSDRYKVRAIPTIILASLAAIGYSLLLASKNKHVAYASLYLTIPGAYGTVPVTVSWLSNNSEPHYRRATTIAICAIATNLGGILSTWSFPTKEAPHFRRATIMNLVFCLSIILFTIINAVLLTHMNESKQRRRNEILEPYIDDKSADGGALAWTELGDKHPDFRYTI